MTRARLELLTAVVFGAAAIGTLIWPTWIESLTPFEPDAGSGEAERWIVGILAVIAVVALLASLWDFRAQRGLRSAEE